LVPFDFIFLPMVRIGVDVSPPVTPLQRFTISLLDLHFVGGALHFEGEEPR
jgi:hypothetical protein